MTNMTDRVCNGWNKVQPVIDLGMACNALCKFGMLGLYSAGKYSRVADIHRLTHLQLGLSALLLVWAPKHLFYDKSYREFTLLGGQVYQGALVGIFLENGLGLTVLLQRTHLVPMGKWALILDRAANVIGGLSVAALASAHFDRNNRNQFGDRISWFESKEQIKENLALLLYFGSFVAIAGLQATSGGYYSMNFAAARALIGCPATLMSIWFTASHIKATWWPAEPNKDVAYD